MGTGRVAALLLLAATTARADDSKLGKEDVHLQTKAASRGKNKLCCGYPIVNEAGSQLT